MNPTIFNLLESWLPTSSNTLATFLFENSCYSFLKTLFSDRHYRIHNWSRKAHGHLWTEDVAEIFCSGPLLGIFAYIFRQRTIIHWWRWLSGAPAAWHHCCWRRQNSTGIDWIPIECSTERNIFWWKTWELPVDGRCLQNFFHSSQIISGELSPFPSYSKCKTQAPT